MLFAGIGPEGQQRLLASRVAIIGCGAIGAAAANLLVRAGVGYLRIIDRDFVEPSNLQPHPLFDESDPLNPPPKPPAAHPHPPPPHSSTSIEPALPHTTPPHAAHPLPPPHPPLPPPTH